MFHGTLDHLRERRSHKSLFLALTDVGGESRTSARWRALRAERLTPKYWPASSSEYVNMPQLTHEPRFHHQGQSTFQPQPLYLHSLTIDPSVAVSFPPPKPPRPRLQECAWAQTGPLPHATRPRPHLAHA